MIILHLIFYAVKGSQLLCKENGRDYSEQFNKCAYSGQNKNSILFQCENQNFLVPKLELTKQSLEIIALKSSEQSFLTNHLIYDLTNTNGMNSLEIKEFLPSLQAKLIHVEQNIQFFQNTQIDSIINIVGMVRIHSVQNYTLELQSQFIQNKNQKLCNVLCDQNCYFKDFKQFHNKMRNTMVIIILEQYLVKIFEYSLIEYKLVEVQKLGLDSIAIQISAITTEYLVIKFQQFQVLYTIGTLFYEINEIYRFDSQPLQFLLNINGINQNYILQQNDGLINLFSLIETSNWQNPIQIVQIQQLEIKYSDIVFQLDSNTLLFIYDQFNRIQIDINLQAKQFIDDCYSDGYEIPIMNMQSIQYQEKILKQASTVSVYNYQKQECDFPCDEIYRSLSIPMMPFKRECVMLQLYDHLVNGCKQFDNCFSCMKQLGCTWNNGFCSSERYDIELNFETPIQSSKWYSSKVLQCGREMQINESIQGQVLEGMVYTWFYDAEKLQQFRLSIKANFGNQKNNIILQSICLGQDQNKLCTYFTINQFKQDYVFKSTYFRFTIVFLEDTFVSDFDILLQQEQPINDQQTKTLYWLSFWVVCVLILFVIIVYVANKRMQFLLSLTASSDLPNLDQLSVDDLINQLVNQKVLTQHLYSPQILMYDEEKCPFCIEKFETKQNLIQIFCGHSFHQNCLEDWMRVNRKLTRCPICNQTIEQFLKNKEQFRNIV